MPDGRGVVLSTRLKVNGKGLEVDPSGVWGFAEDKAEGRSGRSVRRRPRYLYRGSCSGVGPRMYRCEAKPTPPSVSISTPNYQLQINRDGQCAMADRSCFQDDLHGRLTKCPPEPRTFHLLPNLLSGLPISCTIILRLDRTHHTEHVDLDRVQVTLRAPSADPIVYCCPGREVPRGEDKGLVFRLGTG